MPLARPGKSLLRELQDLDSFGQEPIQYTSGMTPDVPGGAGDSGGADEGTVFVTLADTTADVLDNTLVVGTGLKKTVLNPAADETLELGVEVDSGVAFPLAPENWQLFYRDDLQLMYVYDATAAAWVVIGTGAMLDPGSGPGVLTYWDTAASRWVSSDLNYLGYNAAIRQLMVGNSMNPGVLRSIYAHQYFAAGALAVGTIGTQDSGLLSSALYYTGVGGAHIHRDRAASTAKTEIIASATSTLNVNNLANRYNWLFLQELPGLPAGRIVYNTPTNELFQEADYLSLLGAAYTKTYDRNWAGATRNRYCGGAATVTASPPGVMDAWGVLFPYTLPDANFAIVVMGASTDALPTTNPLIPLVNVHVTAHGGQVPWKIVTTAGGGVHYTVCDANTNFGAASVLGPGMDVFDNFTVLAMTVGLVPPFNTLAGAGLAVAEWKLRRHY